MVFKKFPCKLDAFMLHLITDVLVEFMKDNYKDLNARARNILMKISNCL